MTDRELLELAAKAVGISDYKVVKTIGGHEALSFVGRSAIPWQPLIDDADALRLAVKLGLLFKYMIDRYELFMRFYCEELDNDLKPSEATRRAIVRAAAEIGKSL